MKTNHREEMLKLAKKVGMMKEYKKAIEDLEESKRISDELFEEYKSVNFEKGKQMFKTLDFVNKAWKNAIDKVYQIETIMIQKEFEMDSKNLSVILEEIKQQIREA